jgi:dTDP-4-dehydrorhamnose reductase
MRVWVIGASGMLGHDLVATMPASAERAIPSVGRVDVRTDALVRRALDELRPDVVVNASGYTAVDRAEEEPDVANEVNGRAVGRLAAECAARAIALVHFSTDYVFSGTSVRPYREDDACEPLNAYARSKRAGEIAIEASGVRALVIRTQWLFGEHGRSFPRTMIERATARQPTRVVDDQFGRPTYARDLAQWTWALVQRGAAGTIHAANAETATWFDVAQVIFTRLGASEHLRSCTTAEYPTPARRPKYSVLDTGKLNSMIGPVPSWSDALGRFLDRVL